MKQTKVLGDRTNPITRKLLEQAGQDKVIKKVIEGKEEEQKPLSIKELLNEIMERPIINEPYKSKKSYSTYTPGLDIPARPLSYNRYNSNYNTPAKTRETRGGVFGIEAKKYLEETQKTILGSPKTTPADPSTLEGKVAGELTPASDSSAPKPAEKTQETNKKPGFLKRFRKKLLPYLAGAIIGAGFYFGKHYPQNGNQYHAMGPK